MKIKIILICLICLVNNLMGQNRKYYFVQFTDKNFNNYQLTNPQAYLSNASINRRLKQNIAIDSTDLPVTTLYKDSILKYNVNYLYSLKWANGIVFNTIDSTLIDTFLQFTFVKNITLIQPKVVTKSSSILNNKWNFTSNTASNATPTMQYNSAYYGNSYIQNHNIKVDKLHNLGFNGEGVLVAMLDAGFRNLDKNQALEHLFTNNKIKAKKDFVAFQPDSLYKKSISSHGAEVLSTMAGYMPSYLIGTGKDVDLILVRTENANNEYKLEEYNWMAGAEFADSMGTQIINSSLGYVDFDDNTTHTPADFNGTTIISSIAASMAAQKGMVCIVSAGNNGESSNYNKIGSPGDASGVITVGSIDLDNHHSAFSSQGPSADKRIKPDVSTVGQNTTFWTSNNELANGGYGTSFSAPILSGAVACLWQKNPDKTAKQITKAIIMSAHLFNNPDSLYGYGIPDLALADILLNSELNFLENAENNILLMPNPASNVVSGYVKCENKSQVSATIYDANGKLILEKTFSTSIGNFSRLDFDEIANFANGNYLIKFNWDNNKTQTKKFVKIK